MALHWYHEAHGRFPPAVVRAKDGRPLYSWRVLLLPYLDQESLFKEFRPDEAWDSSHNQSLLARMPKEFLAPAEQGLKRDPQTTFYQVFVGPETAFEGDRGMKYPVDFPDGSKTILIIEAAEAVPWTKPVDVIFHPDGPLPRVGGIFTFDGRFSLLGSSRIKGFNVAFADGATRWIAAELPGTTLRALITRIGSAKVDLGE